MTIMLVHHAASRGHGYPPGSLSALRVCLEAGARVVEVDINPLAGGDFALLHDAELERATDGAGHVSTVTASQVRRLHYTRHGVVTAEPVGLVSEAVALIRSDRHLQELQLDLKPDVLPTDALFNELLRLVSPVKDRVRVSSGADWALRRLRALDPGLPLGSDPFLYLDMDSESEPRPPFRVGAYGYRDDHPLASRRWGPTADYLAARAEALWAQAPPCAVWYIRASVLARGLDDGFDWIAYLHQRGAQVDAWTLDAEQPGHIEIARRLMAAGLDRLTTNDAPLLAAALDDVVM